MFFGACAGSTSGGAKIDRMVILTKNARNEFNRVLYPNVIRPVLYNGKALSHETVSKILAFTIMYVIVLTSKVEDGGKKNLSSYVRYLLVGLLILYIT